MRNTGFVLLLILIVSLVDLAAADDKLVSQIAFGSCAQQDQPQPIWNTILRAEPDMFLFIGDNIYGDSEDMSVLQGKWDQLAAMPGFQRVREAMPMLATWDDHDYGLNDGGVEYPMKVESQKVFLDFFEEPADSPRRQRKGIYDAKMFGPEGKRVQVILLDTRYFRSPLVKAKTTPERATGRHGPYQPSDDSQATVLGEAQWKWLAEQLKVPAELRIVASSIQVIPNEHRWEKWGNFPHDRQRLLDLIKQSQASGVVFISGDRHHAEISQLEGAVGYPLVDVTSSSLNKPMQRWRNELNPHRVGLIFGEENFGMISIDWQQDDPTVRFAIKDIDGNDVLLHSLQMSELQAK